MSLDSVFKRSVYWIKDVLHGGTILKMYMGSKKVDSNYEYGEKWQQKE